MAEQETEQQQQPVTKAATPQADQQEDDAHQQEVSNAEQQLHHELESCRAEVEKHKDLYLRTRAEMENYRRRMQREKEDLSKFANEAILRDILPVIDNLQRAVAHARDDGSDNNSATLIEGVEMTLNQFQSVLEKFKVTVIEAKGKPFNPDCHEAMGQLERDDCEPNTVVEVMQNGYMLNDRLLRPALVMVSKAVSNAERQAE